MDQQYALELQKKSALILFEIKFSFILEGKSRMEIERIPAYVNVLKIVEIF